jgi:hypothetical protein
MYLGGRSAEVIGTIENITDRKKAEETLKRNYEELRNFNYQWVGS